MCLPFKISGYKSTKKRPQNPFLVQEVEGQTLLSPTGRRSSRRHAAKREAAEDLQLLASPPCKMTRRDNAKLDSATPPGKNSAHLLRKKAQATIQAGRPPQTKKPKRLTY